MLLNVSWSEEGFETNSKYQPWFHNHILDFQDALLRNLFWFIFDIIRILSKNYHWSLSDYYQNTLRLEKIRHTD
jgi:hypothetical protein